MVTKNSGLRPLEPAPYYLQSLPKADAGEEVLNTRGERLFQLLGENRKFTLDEIKQLSVDTYVMPADVIVPLLINAVASAEPVAETRLTKAVESLKAWDRQSSRDSVAYTYLHFWGKAYQELFPGRFSRFVSQDRKRIDPQSAEERKQALAALKVAIDRMEKNFGTAEIPWGKVNVTFRGETFPMDGNSMYGVLHPDHGLEQENGQISCNDGWGHLMVAMEGDPKEIWSLLPYGQSESSVSPHYNDQTRLHSRGQMKRFWFTPREILDHTESVWGDRERIRKLIK